MQSNPIQDQWKMGCSGKRHPHQYPGTESRMFCAEGLPKKQIQFECPFTDRQLNSMCLCKQKRWHTLESIKCTSPRNLRLVSAAQNYNQSTTCARQASCRTRLRIKTFTRPQRLATKTSIYPKIFTSRFGRSFRNSFKKTNCQLCQLYARSRDITYRCLHSKLVRRKGVRLPPVSLITKVIMKVLKEQATIVLVAPVWKTQPWWPLLLKMCWKSPVLLPQTKDLLLDLTNPAKVHPLYPRLTLGVFFVSGNVMKTVAFLRRQLSSCCQPTQSPPIKTYQSAWKKWDSWCRATKVDPIRSSLRDILHFLTDMFDKGHEYRTISVLRSALSSVREKKQMASEWAHIQMYVFYLKEFQHNDPQNRSTAIFGMCLKSLPT